MAVGFSKTMSTLRRERGISQKQAAIDLGVSQALLSHYEKGIRECGLDFLSKCARYYGVSADYLLGLTSRKTLLDSASDKSDIGKVQTTTESAQKIIFELLRRCDNKDIVKCGSELLELQAYQAVLYIFSLCGNELPFTLANRYSKPAAEAEISKCFAKLGLIKENGKGEEAIRTAAQNLNAEYPSLYKELLKLVANVEKKIK